MLTLKVRTSDNEEVCYTLAPQVYIIGRASVSDIPVKVGPVSRQHARLTVTEQGETILEDLGSANGTFLEGRPLTCASAWRPNESATVGDATLTLVETSDDAGSQEPFSALEAGTLPAEFHLAERYTIGAEIARGGMGAILTAQEATTRRAVAMKIIAGSEDDRVKLRFIEEAQITAQLEHPNVVPVHELGLRTDGQLYYTMKRVRGITLKRVIELLREGVPPVVEKYSLAALLTILQKTCDALAYAHARGVIHRDVKPANIMVGEYGEVLVMDWGIAKLIRPPAQAHESIDVLNFESPDQVTLSVPNENGPPVPDQPQRAEGVSSSRSEAGGNAQTRTGSLMGTPNYMAPEQVEGENSTLDQRVDVWALGVILYEILTLARPFAGRNQMELFEKISRGEFQPPAERIGSIPLRHLPEGLVPPSLDAICRKALTVTRGGRYQSVIEFQSDLTAYQTGFATAAEGRTSWKQFTCFIRRNRAVATSVAVALGVVALIVSAFTFRLVR